MRDRRDDERSFRGPMGPGGRDEDRFRDRDRDREWERDRTWRREEDMGGSRWSGASGRGGYESRLDEHGHEPHHAGHEREYGYGASSEGWGGDRDRYERDFSGRDFGHERVDYDDRPRNLGARDYETRHFYGGRGGFDRSYDRGYDASGPSRSFDRDRGAGGPPMASGWQGSYGGGDPARGASMGRPPMGRPSMARPQGMYGMQRTPGGRMGGSDLGFSYRGHEGGDDLDDRGPHYGKGPKGYKRSDERVREDVCDCIARQGHIDASDVEVKVENGSVILTGTVGERHHKRVLEQMVERLHGVDDVRNELRLKRDEQTQMRSQQGTQQTQQGSQQGHNGDQNRQSQMPNGKNARA